MPAAIRAMKVHPRLQMIRTSNCFKINLICFALAICLNSYVSAEPTSDKAGFQIKDGKISANLINASLRDIVDKITAQGVIWSEVNTDPSDYKVSAQFADIPLDEGLKRILKGMNHSLVYNADGRIARVFILGRGERNQRNSRTPTIVPVNMHAIQPAKAISGPAVNTVIQEPSSLKSANPSRLPRAFSGRRTNSLDMSLNLNNRMSAQ